MNTPNNAAALERLEKFVSVRERMIGTDPHVVTTSNDAELRMSDLRSAITALRATLSQPDALTSQPSGGAVRWPERMVNLPCPHGTTDRIVGFRVEEGSQILGKFGLSEALAWLRSVTADRHTHPSADAPGVAVDAKYAELIYAVGRKWPGETRHQTALRYINERESLSSAKDCGSSAALSPAKENGRE